MHFSNFCQRFLIIFTLLLYSERLRLPELFSSVFNLFLLFSKFKERNSKRKLKSILNNISCFNQYLYNNKDIIYIIIKISWIFVKDKNLYIGYNDNNNIKIIERTYEPEFKNALYNNYLIN